MKKTLQGLDEFKAFAREFAATLRGGEVIGLIGDLGAGKTTFVQEVAAALGVRATPKSPTFVLMQIYDASAKKQGIARLCHVDAYRLDDVTALRKIGFDEYAGDPGTISIVEWADRVPELRQGPTYREVAIAIADPETRTIRATKGRDA